MADHVMKISMDGISPDEIDDLIEVMEHTEKFLNGTAELPFPIFLSGLMTALQARCVVEELEVVDVMEKLYNSAKDVQALLTKESKRLN